MMGRPVMKESNYIACINWDFGWDKRDIDDLKHYWIEGLSWEDISRAFNRHPGEVLCLILDLYEQEILPERQGGIYGRRRRG